MVTRWLVLILVAQSLCFVTIMLNPCTTPREAMCSASWVLAGMSMVVVSALLRRRGY